MINEEIWSNAVGGLPLIPMQSRIITLFARMKKQTKKSSL